MDCGRPDLTDWLAMVDRVRHISRKVRIALVGKYVELRDAYLSVAEALRHGGISNGAEVEIDWVSSEDITPENVVEKLAGADGILVPGGFGDRGIEGKITTVRYARESKVPFFGVCLGMQMAVVEFARNVLHLDAANSTEFAKEGPYPVIDLMPEQRDIEEMGGTMRLGLYPCKLSEGSVSRAVYGRELIYERHRHRYEFNNHFREQFQEKGLCIAGLSPSERLVEIVELPDHPWFVGVQFHPEFKSRPNRPHPLFADFIRASLQRREKL